jgi:hypothetical protein
MGVIWLSPNSYVTTDPTVKIAYASPARPAAAITCTAAGTKSITAALVLPPRAVVHELIVCYECSDAASHIAGVKLVETTLPGVAVVRLDSPLRLDSTRRICVPIKFARFTPSGSVILELQLRFANTAHEISFGGLGVRVGDDCSAARNDHVLGEYGAYLPTPKEAYETLAKAVDAILAEGGGVLCIPRDAPHGFFPRNTKEDGLDKPAVTIVDHRHGVEHTYVPPIGITNSEGSAVAGRIIERDLAQNLEWQNSLPVVAVTSRAAAGASSLSTRLSRAAAAGADQRLYIPTLRGAFIGQKLLVDPGPTEEVITVEGLGLDGDKPYLIADTRFAHAAGVQIYNKNDVGALSINDVSNCDNQSASLILRRTTYGTGDSFGVAAILTYQGNINSGGGDEGAVAFAGNLEQDIDSFTGEVETWDKDKRLLKYKAGAQHPQKLGTSRPLINFNESKHVKDGLVQVMDTGGGHTVVVGDAAASAKWSEALAGRFFAINDPTEYYPQRMGRPMIERKLRWWLINKIEPAMGGPKKLYVERAIAEEGFFSGPTLLRADNIGKSLPYIIAPGAWVSDVRNAVAGTIQGHIGSATMDDPRTIELAPSPTIGTADDFTTGDPIINPPGSDPWIPTGFRARHVHHFPSRLKGASFLAENLGNVQVGPAVAVHGKGDSSSPDAVRDRMKDRSMEFESALYVNAATDKAIVIRGAVATETAIELWQPHGNVKKIRWLTAGGTAAGDLHVDPVEERFIFAAKGGLDLTLHGTIQQTGLSATATPSATLGGRNKGVPGKVLSVKVDGLSEADTAYTVFVTCSWQTTTVITNKMTDSFLVEFGSMSPAGGGLLDWFLVRLP